MRSSRHSFSVEHDSDKSEKMEIPYEASFAWENSSFGFIEDVHQWK